MIDTATADEFILGVNANRKTQLTLNEKLMDASDYWSRVMSIDRCLYHPDILLLMSNLFDYGVTYCGQCVAEGQTTVCAAVEAWMADPTHREIIMDERYTECGVGFNNGYWCATFASRDNNVSS